MMRHSLSPVMIFRSFWKNRNLLWQMVKREVIGRYRGSFMGLLWSFFNPLLMLCVYTFVFGVVFKTHWSEGETSVGEFAVILFAGLIVFNLFAECLSRAPGLILGNANYVKKVVFPLEILPWVIIGAALFHLILSVLVLLFFYAILHLSLNWTVIFLPFVFLPFLFFTMGLSWFLSSIGVYVRDVGQVMGVIILVAMFMSPIFYPVSALPESLRWIQYFLNPLTFIIEQTRSVLLWGQPPHWLGLGLYFTISLVVASLGFAWFQKTRNGFADVI